MKKIGFIGTGIMGHGMIRNLRKAGFEVQIYNRTKEKAEDLLAEGCTWTESPADCARGVDCVITIVGMPADVEEVYFGEYGVLNGAVPGTVLIDMTTTKPSLAEKIYRAAKEKGLEALDAPVSGGNTGAINGTLAIMTGGDKETFEKALPVLRAMGTNVVYEGKAGAGQHTKMANQIAIAGALSGVCEAMTYARETGLDMHRVFNTIRTGAAGSVQMDSFAPKMIDGDFAATFYMKHFVKDLGIGAEEMEKRGISLEILDKVLEMTREVEKEGFGGEGTQALYHHYEKKGK